MTTWLEHVKNVKKQNGGLQLKDILKLASKTYKKGGGDSSGIVPASEYKNDHYGTVGTSDSRTPDQNQLVDPYVGGGKKKRRKSQKKRKRRNKSKKSRRRKTKKSRRKSSKK